MTVVRPRSATTGELATCPSIFTFRLANRHPSGVATISSRYVPQWSGPDVLTSWK